MSELSDYKHVDIKPPGPSPARGYVISPTVGNEDDDARYILRPDVEFYRPWVASPGVGNTGIAFVWPMGIQGFTLASTADLGIHKYIGDNDIDVDVIFPQEYHVTMTGIFPGKKGIKNAQQLRTVIQHPSSEGGKVLCLPGVQERILYVSVVNYNFAHAEGEMSDTITYSIDFVQQGVGAKVKQKPLRHPRRNPTTKVIPRGKSHKQTKVKGKKRTVKGIAHKVHKDPAQQHKILSKNTNDLVKKTGIPAHKLPYTRLPPGTNIRH